ncbi:MAG: hypothetical protein HOQ24_08685 [Mycobacteriaceae bacterium]|nr:hypothetical protein [Mycobacteriaceae bacterium]
MNPLHRLPASTADCTPIITPYDCGPIAMPGNVMYPTTTPGCRPIITPTDCGPAAAPPTLPPAATPSAPVGPGTSPVPGPAQHSGQPPSWLEWMDSHRPPTVDVGAGWIGHVGEFLLGASAGVGFTGAVIGGAMLAARNAGWDAHRLRNYAAGSMVLPVAVAATSSSAVEPGWLFAHGAALAAHGAWLPGAMQMSVLAVPAGLTAATVWWARSQHRLDTVGKKNPPKTERVQQHRTNAKLAAARTLATRATPLTVVTGTGRGNRQLVMGRLANQVAQHRKSTLGMLTAGTDTLLTIPHSAVRHHIGVLGGPGSGKTTGMKRLSVASHIASHERYLAAARLPRTVRRTLGVTPNKALGIFLSCKGGDGDLELWAELRTALLAAGVHPERIAMAPATKLRLWGLDVAKLRHVVEDLAPTAEANEAASKFYEEMRISLTYLIIDAPDPANGKGPGENPPQNSGEFMNRFDAAWLWQAWGGEFNDAGFSIWPANPEHKPELKAIEASIQGKQPVLNAEAARFGNLFRELDGVFDGDTDLTDKDYWFITVPGTAQKSVATAQAKAVIKLVEQVAATPGHNREITFTVDEFSRVSGGASLIDACEALRSQGVGCIVGAHSFESLAATDRDSKRQMKAWSGGLLCFRMDGPDEIVQHYGTRRALEPSQHTKGKGYGDEGSARMQDALLVDPNLLRRLTPGDCVYIHHGKASWGRVSELDPTQIPLLPTEPVPGRKPRDTHKWRRAGAALLHGKGAPA